MKKHFIYLLALGSFITSECSALQLNKKEIIEINVTKAQKNKKEIRLSELVKDVEILVLESNIDCFMQAPYNLKHFGKKYILFHENGANQLFLFGRDGKFIRRIGRPGKGPGEYNRGIKAILSKDESRIMVTDGYARRVIVYDEMGLVMVQKDLSEYFLDSNILELSSDFDNLFTFVPHRPYGPRDGFSSLLMFDYELNKKLEVLPRPNDENLCSRNLIHVSLLANKKGTYFTEMYKDTVYQYFDDGSSIPRYRFTVEKNKLPESLMDKNISPRELYKYTFPAFISFLPDYLFIQVMGSGNVFYHFKTGEASNVSFKNDMFGINAALNGYHPDQDLCVRQFRWGDYAEFYKLKPIRKMEVSLPDIRDQLLEYAENPTDDLGPVLILMHLK